MATADANWLYSMMGDDVNSLMVLEVVPSSSDLLLDVAMIDDMMGLCTEG